MHSVLRYAQTYIETRYPEAKVRTLTAYHDNQHGYTKAESILQKAGYEVKRLVHGYGRGANVTGLEVWEDEMLVKKTAVEIGKLLPGYEVGIKDTEYIIIK